MNYRHIFHAGNFADLVKHALLTVVLARLAMGARRLNVIDTHAGAGLYDLTAAEVARSGEAEAGVGRLLADPNAPAVFDALKAVLSKLNPSNSLRQYPGSPWLIAEALRPGDQLTACELRPDEFAALARTIARPGAQALQSDGYAAAPQRLQPGQTNLILIDPPFERGDEYSALLSCIDKVMQRDPGAVIIIWLPLKDLETFDGFLRGLEALGTPALVAETRLRRLHDPMRMNGCALVVINDPPGTEEDARQACEWAVSAIGEAGGQAQVWRL